MARTMNMDVPTPRETAMACHRGRRRPTDTTTPAARPAVAAMTAGNSSATLRGWSRISEDRSPPTTTNPGRPGLTGPGGGILEGRADTPPALARAVRHE